MATRQPRGITWSPGWAAPSPTSSSSLSTIQSDRAGPITYVAPEGQGTNNLTLSLDGSGNIDLYDNGTLVDSMPAALASSVNIYGAGDGTLNNLTIDFSGGNPIPYGGVQFEGGGSAGDNTLNLKNGDFELEDYTPTGPDSGVLAVSR